MRIIEEINQYIVNPFSPDQRGRFAHYPSEASIISRIDGEIMGACHRKVWYNWTGVVPTRPIDARGQWTFTMGKLLEGAYVEYCKEIGIWAGNNVKYYDRIHNISGEADIFVWGDKERLIKVGVEIKTAYGYGFSHSVSKFPKIENLLQVALYLDFFQLPEWHLIYKARDTQEDVEYVITMDADDKGKFLCIDGNPCHIFYLEDIYTRYRELGDYVVKKELPPRDFTYGYSAEESMARLESGKISKTKMSKIGKEDAIDSDWQCLYCGHMNTCWAEKLAQQK